MDRPERRSTRRSPAHRLRLRSASLPVRLLDLSEGGLAVESRRPMRIGACYPFCLEGDPVAGGDFVGRVLWCRLARTERADNGDVHPVYRAGLERLPPDEGDEEPS